MIFGGYEVWIADSNSKALPEYQVEGDRSTFSCYIPSESGKRFSIRWKDHNGPASHHTSMQTYVDGLHAGKKYCSPGASGKRKGISQESATIYYPFQFAPLQTTDDDGTLWGGAVSDQLGTIELRVIHVHPHVRTKSFKPSTFSGVSTVHEQSKKAGAHCVALGRAERYKNPYHQRVRTTPLDKRAGPFATFVFRYRPADILQAQGIVPAPSMKAEASTESKPGKSKKKVRGPRRTLPVPADAPQERIPLKREVSDQRIDLGVIELTDDEDEDRKPIVKHELRHRRSFDPDDVIDLTLD